MTIRVGLERYTVMAKHGYYAFEHEQEQPFVFTVWATLSKAKVGNELSNTLNYADIQVAIDHVMLESEAPIALMEEMAEQVIEQIAASNSRRTSCSGRETKCTTSPPWWLPVIEVEWHRN